MRRMTTIMGVVAAMATLSGSQAFAGHTAAEFHMFFGAPLVNPTGAQLSALGSVVPTAGEIASNPSASVLGGTIVALPIWIRVLGTAGGGNGNTSLQAVGFKVYDEGDTAFVSNSGNGNNNAYLGHSAQFISAGAGGGGANTLTATLKEFRTGYYSLYDGAASSQLAPLTIAFLGYMQVTTLATTTTKNVDFFFSQGSDANRVFQSDSAVASANTVAFGAGTDTQSVNTFRRDITANDVIGSVANFDVTSTLADAHITVTPEPATLGLLALGLATLRRRRSV